MKKFKVKFFKAISIEMNMQQLIEIVQTLLVGFETTPRKKRRDRKNIFIKINSPKNMYKLYYVTPDTYYINVCIYT